MAKTTVTVILRLLIALTFVVFTSVAGPCVLGQVPALAPPALSDGEMPSAASRPLELPPQPIAGPIAAAPVSDGYWIASSWKCRQHWPHDCSCGDLDFYYSTQCGSVQHLNREAFQASLTPGAPVCVVVHGSFTNWRGLCDECDPLYRWIRGAAPHRPLHVIFYTWPSDGPITYEPHVDVALLGMRASFNSVYLADLVAHIPPGHPVCIMGHSHGARLVVAGLHLLAGGEVDGTHLNYPPPPTLRLRAVLMAAAMDHNWLNPDERFGLALCRAECLLNMQNQCDMVMSIYPLRRPFSHHALGQSGLSSSDRAKLGPLGSKFAEMDVATLVGSNHTWRYYYSRPELAAAMVPYVFYEEGAAPLMPLPEPLLPAAPTPAAARSDAPPRFMDRTRRRASSLVPASARVGQ